MGNNNRIGWRIVTFASMAGNLKFWNRKRDNMQSQEENSTKNQEQEEVNLQAEDNMSDNSATSSTDTELSETEQLRAEVAELNDKLLRTFSEFENSKRRMARERLELINSASKNIILELLPVIDDLERALTSAQDKPELDAFAEGIKLVHNKFLGILSKQGLEAISSVGENFDLDLHEAVSKMPAPSDDQKNKVMFEVEKGYKLKENVIRFSKVIVGV